MNLDTKIIRNRKISLGGVGKYLPKKLVLAQEIYDRLGKNSKRNKLNILHRHFSNQDETTSYMATQASLQALKNANLKAEDLDCIIGACGVMEQAIPGTSVLVQKKLGLENSGIATFDINTTCLSFLSALDIASYMIDAGRFKNILIFASDIPSLGLNWNDEESCIIFGDGAAAAIFSNPKKNTEIEIISSLMETYSKGSDYCRVKAGGTLLHPTKFKGDLLEFALFEMNGKSAYKLTAEMIKNFIKKLFSQTNLQLSDIDLVIPHQASSLALHHLRKELNIPKEKIIDIFATHGNQVAASIPSSLFEAVTSEKIKRGDRVLMIGTGAGISIGGIILEYNQ
jgi:3-oxoacyl-[acyl-carrier-protein] synthase-3